jgi:hypothetical protein
VVLARGPQGAPIALEQAIAAGGTERQHIEAELGRLERMLPVLGRPGGIRRGQVILSGDEAWDLMAATGPRLQLAGFDVRVPELSRRPSTPSLRIFVDSVNETAVGAIQLRMRWSALFDDNRADREADIALPAEEARPLVRSGSRWISIDRADLNAAAKPASQRARRSNFPAEMLAGARTRGLPLAGGISIDGGAERRSPLRQPMSRRIRARRLPPGSCALPSRALAWLARASSTPRARRPRSTWAWARRRRCSRTCWPASKTDRRW